MLLREYDIQQKGNRMVLMDTRKTNLFSPNRVEQLIKDAGAYRVSKYAILDLEYELFNYGKMIAREATSIAKKDKRMTVITGDIVLAMSNVNSILRQKRTLS